ncbi:hypothetical protein OPT61_g3771 [Boeremia exigua]|uniref:Uncharacterized protein n=1 Tax=Boeremia exigua TaxID=749465 RepID=A0ACC2IGK1_9PLEO|nr:hypothetical protein OPT61_g3771 [Boeremia exigua]
MSPIGRHERVAAAEHELGLSEQRNVTAAVKSPTDIFHLNVTATVSSAGTSRYSSPTLHNTTMPTHDINYNTLLKSDPSQQPTPPSSPPALKGDSKLALKLIKKHYTSYRSEEPADPPVLQFAFHHLRYRWCVPGKGEKTGLLILLMTTCLHSELAGGISEKISRSLGNIADRFRGYEQVSDSAAEVAEHVRIIPERLVHDKRKAPGHIRGSGKTQGNLLMKCRKFLTERKGEIRTAVAIKLTYQSPAVRKKKDAGPAYYVVHCFGDGSFKDKYDVSARRRGPQIPTHLDDEEPEEHAEDEAGDESQTTDLSSMYNFPPGYIREEAESTESARPTKGTREGLRVPKDIDYKETSDSDSDPKVQPNEDEDNEDDGNEEEGREDEDNEDDGNKEEDEFDPGSEDDERPRKRHQPSRRARSHLTSR